MRFRKSTVGLKISLIIACSSLFFTANAATSGYQGYVFCAVGQTAYLINPAGTTVHTWRASGSARSYALLLPDGSALFPILPPTACVVRGDGAYPHGRIQKISWEGQIVWDAVVCDSSFTPGYTIEPMPNGNFMVAGSSNTGAFKIVEIKPTGTSGKEIVWSYDLSISGAGNMTRINSISYNPDLGDSGYVLANVNDGNPNRLLVIDKAKKTIVFTYNVTTGSLIHAGIWATRYFLGTKIKMPDADTVAMRVNNILTANNSVQVVEANPITKLFVKNIAFRFGAHEGSVQRLPNGNTFVNASNNKAIELKDDGTTVKTITLPGTVARAYMYGPSYPGLKTYVNTLKAASTVKLTGSILHNSTAQRAEITVMKNAGSLLMVRVYSADGRTVYSSSSYKDRLAFSTKTFRAGIYYVEARHDRGSIKKSIIVAR